jgi:hypothetical protein
MKLEARLIKRKIELDKIALREPRTLRELKVRKDWERIRNILSKRYDRNE